MGRGGAAPHHTRRCSGQVRGDTPLLRELPHTQSATRLDNAAAELEAFGGDTDRPTPAMAYSVTIEPGASDDVPAAVRRGIRGGDPPDVGPRDYEPLVFALRDPGGAVVGGAYGATMWGWLMLDGLWVDAALRGRGLGGRLLDEAEALARRRGCRAAWLDTFDFQARLFYERQGYRVVAALEGFPAGHTHYRLRKDLGPAA